MKLHINSCDGIYESSLDVRFCRECDNNCSYCIEKNGIDSLGKPDVQALIQSTLDTNKKNILILGGEPFLYPTELLNYILGIRNYVDNIYITTSLPKTMTEHTNVVDRIISLIDGLNVSVHHHNSQENNRILQSTVPYNRIDYLSKLCSDQQKANKIRVCCNLTNGFICTYSDIRNFSIAMQSIGVKHIKFNELQHADSELYVSIEKCLGVRLPSPYANGCQTDETGLFYRLIPELDNQLKITVKRSCFNVCSQARASVQDLVKCVYKRFLKPSSNEETCLVLYENGEVYSGWQSKK